MSSFVTLYLQQANTALHGIQLAVESGPLVLSKEEVKNLDVIKRQLRLLRDNMIYMSVLAGIPRKTIAEQHGLTSGRVSQIYSDYAKSASKE